MASNVGNNSFDQKDHANRIKGVDPVRELKVGRDTTRTVNKWDRYLGAREAAEGGSFGEALAAHDKSTAWAAFARETFSKLYDSGLGNDLPDEERPMGSDWVSKLHESAEALPEWRALKERARRDSWACGVAAGEALRVLAQQVKPPDTDPQAIQDELDFVKSLAEEGGKTHPQHLKRLAALQRQVRDANEEHARATQLLSSKSAAVRSALRGAAMKAQDQISEFDDAMLTLGASDGAGIQSRVNAPPQQIRATLMKNAKLRKILKLAGRMKNAAIQKQRTKARPGCEELCDVKPGNDLSRLLPSELVNLGTPDTEAMLYRRIIESSALTYELRGKEQRNEGPIIMAVDESGSMAGQPDEWAKSVAMALMEIAARQNRPFAYIHFNTQVTRVDEVKQPKSMTLAQLEELATYFTSGGTYIGAALEHCAKMLEDAHKERGDKPWKRADVVLVTDGMSGDNDRQNKAIDRIHALGGHLYSIFIGFEGCTDPCDTRADSKMAITARDIASGDPSKLGTIFSI
jgi:uncharacterized protein with von Willebrand factor type A (vWA) domain